MCSFQNCLLLKMQRDTPTGFKYKRLPSGLERGRPAGATKQSKRYASDPFVKRLTCFSVTLRWNTVVEMLVAFSDLSSVGSASFIYKADAPLGLKAIEAVQQPVFEVLLGFAIKAP